MTAKNYGWSVLAAAIIKFAAKDHDAAFLSSVWCEELYELASNGEALLPKGQGVHEVEGVLNGQHCI